MCQSLRLCVLALAPTFFSFLSAAAAADPVSPPITDLATGQPVMYPSYLTEYDGMLYFRGRLPGDDSTTGLWSTDGTFAYHVAGTGLGGAVTEPSHLAAYEGSLYFAGTASSGGPPRLWQYHPDSGASPAPGTAAGTQQNPEELTVYGGNLYFRAARFGAPSNIGIEFWKFDGASQTPIDMCLGNGSSYPQHFIEYDGLLYFNACGEPGQGSELWSYGGSGVPVNAATIYRNNGSSPEQFAPFDGRLFFSAYDGVHGRELWSYDGTSAAMVADIVPGGQYDSSNPNNLCVYDGKLYFSATDGPEAHGYELWSYDGVNPPQMVVEINPSPNPGNGDDWLMDSSPSDLTVFNGLLYFSANDGQHGRELWSFDGTTARLVADINEGLNGSEVANLTVFDGRLYFTADAYFTGLGELQPRILVLAVPEPAALALAAMAGLGILGSLWRRQTQSRRLAMRSARSVLLSVVCLCAAWLAAGTASAGLWEVIGRLSPDLPTEAVAVSADGSVIVGSSGTPDGQRAFRWTLETGIQALPMPESGGVTMTWATDLSSDGSVIVGYGGNSFGSRQGWVGLVWEDLTTPGVVAVEYKGVWLKGVSGDGSVIVGTQHGVAALELSEAFRLLPGGVPTPLSNPLFPEATVQSDADAVSADGQVVVGDITSLDPVVRNGFRWTDAGGMTGVGNFSVAAASRDGSVVVGTIDVPGQGFQAFRWTDLDGVTPLGLYAPGYTSQALGVSGDGSVIVGFVEDTSTDLRQAFIWKESTGIRLLQDVLVQRYGFDLTGWSLTKAYAISDDGVTVVGRGYSPQGIDEAWRAVLMPEPGTGAMLAVLGALIAIGAVARRRRTDA